MLYIVLTLVLAALGLVVSALVTANSLWAWISIALSGVAGVLLVVDWWRRRSANSADGDAASPTEDRPPASEADDSGASGKAATATAADSADREDADRETALLPVSGRLVGADGEPIEEQTDEADALVVTELDVDVLVVDEHPRYHLAECGWLADTDTIPLPVNEARELGFTPCALCGPDATLAADRRTSRVTRK